MVKALKALVTAFTDPKFKKIWTPTAQGAQGNAAWSDDNFRVDRGALPGQRVLQVNKQTQIATLKQWIRNQGSKGTHANLATFQIDEKEQNQILQAEFEKVTNDVYGQAKEKL